MTTLGGERAHRGPVDVDERPLEVDERETGGGRTALHGGPVRTGDDSSTTAGRSMTVAGWTVISRVTGLLRVVVIAAVLGPTYFGNLYQATNLLPNITYEFLTGSLFASLLVPAMVRHVDRRDRRATERLASGFLGVALLAITVVVALLVLAGGLVVRVLSLGVSDPQVVLDLQRLGWVLLALVAPQVLFYAVVGTAVATQNAHGRFAFPAAAPAVENLGLIAVLAGYAVVFGTGPELSEVGFDELLLLGGGSTAAVGLHAAVQWWGAHRVGVDLRPRAGWRDPEVRAVVRLAVPSLGHTGLNATRLLGLLVAASSVPGGVVAFQLAMNFYNLPVALAGRSVAQAVLPQLSRAHRDGDQQGFRDTLVHGTSLMAFVTVPAAVAFVVLAQPLAEAVSYGEMATGAGVALLAAAIAGLGAGALGESAYIIGTHASYARRDARTPLRVMGLRTAVSMAGVGIALLFTGPAHLLALGLAVSAGDLVAAATIGLLLRRTCAPGRRRLLPGAARAAAAASLMVVPAYVVTVVTGLVVGGPSGPVLGLAAGAATGLVVYLLAQYLLESPELRLLAQGLAARRSALRSEARGTHHGAVRRRAAGAASGAAALTAVAAGLWPGPVALVAAGGLAVAVIALRPAWAAYAYLGLTPLVVGVDRGTAAPLVRPQELLLALLWAGLLVWLARRWCTSGVPAPVVLPLDAAVVVLAVAGSVTPLLWMYARGREITVDDVLFALTLWKYLALYVLVRVALRSAAQVRRALAFALAATAVVAVIGVLQALELFGVPGLLTAYAPLDDVEALSINRASSTIGTPIGFGDVMILGVAIGVGWSVHLRTHRLLIGGCIALFALAALASGQASTVLGLVFAAVVVGAKTRRSGRVLLMLVPLGAVALVVLAPVIAARLDRLDPSTGLPISWTGEYGRLTNLREHIWPRLAEDHNWLFGVRPLSRVAAPEPWREWIWIESGHTWLLWNGGVVLLLAFAVHLLLGLRTSAAVVARGAPAEAAAAVAASTGLWLLAFLMTFDPHLTIRGSADLLFPLLAMAASAFARERARGGVL